MSNNERRWTRTSIDCYNRCYSNDGTFRNGCVNCPDKEFCKTADFTLLQVVNDLIELCGKPSIKKEKEFILSGFCIDQDCKYCKLLEDDKLQIFCKHPYKFKKTFPKYGFKCQQYEKRTQEEEKQPMNYSVGNKIEILQKFIHLSPRENDVLSLYLEGKNNAEVIQKLHISEGALIQYDFALKKKFKKYINFDNSNKMQQIVKFVNNLDPESLPKPIIATSEIKTIPLMEPQPEIIHNFKAPTLIKKEVSISDLIERVTKKITTELNETEKEILNLVINNTQSNEVRATINSKKEKIKELNAQIKAIEAIGKELLEMEQE